MEPAVIYAWLMDGREALENGSDAHVLASMLALAIAEAKAGGLSISETTGLTGPALLDAVAQMFPHGLPLIEEYNGSAELSIPDDERALRELLMRSATNRTVFEIRLAAIIARRAMRPNHLWQDCGLRNRTELSEVLRTHFTPLASRNVNNMKWKKFFYRMICRDEGFRLCTAPSCSECDDFAVCFGDESGESLLARNRRQSELYVIAAAGA